MVAIVSTRSVRRFLLGVAFANAGGLGFGGLEISSTQAQTASTALPPVTVDAPQRQQRRAAAPTQRSRTRSTAAGSRSRGTGAEPAASTVAGQGVRLNPGSDSLQPLGGQLPQPTTLTKQITQSATVVERGQIEQTSPNGLLDILANVPGISIARSGGIGGQIYLRGFSSNAFRSPLFVDGDRFRGRNTLQLNYFAPEELERVEVIRGPASVIYGSEALTGLVNIVTRSPTGDPNGPFRFTGGGWSAGGGSAAKSLGTYEWAQGAGGGFDFLGGFSGRWGSNYNTPLGQAPNSDYNSMGGSLKLGYTPDLGQRFELTLRKYSETDGRAGGVGGAPGAPFTIVRQDPNNVQTARLAYTGELDGLVRHVEASVYANYFDTTLTTTTNTFAGNNPNNVATRTVTSNSHVIGPLVIGGRVLGAIPWSGGLGEAKTTFGGDTFKEDRPGSWGFSQTVNRNATTGAVTSTVNAPLAKSGPDTTQTNAGAFVLHEWTPVAPLTLSAGGRYDWFNTTTDLSPIAPAVLPAFIGKSNVDRTAPTGSVGVVYRVLPVLDLLANVATSFRQPTNSELFTSSATSIPNPGLVPETGVTYEGGFRFHVSNATLKVTAFNSKYENFLQTVPVVFNGSAGFTQSQNIGKAEVNGVELEERWQATETVNLFGSATYIRGTNTTANTPLPFLSPFRGRVGVQYAAVDASFSVEGVIDWAARKSRIDATQEFQTAGYAIPKLYATFQLGKLITPQWGDTKLIVGVENIFDTAYRDASTFANVAFPQTLTNPLVEVGRNFTAKVQHTF
jgi:hemoglobin/transferrin/lactoferrin receptor protein